MVLPGFELRVCTLDDLDTVFSITADAMRAAVETTWGEWDAGAQRQRLAATYDFAAHRFIVVDGAMAGVCASESWPDHVFLGKLYLRASHQRRGLGAAVLASLVTEAHIAAKPLRLRVLDVNLGAQRFYRREGFVETGVAFPYRWFERAPNAKP